MESPTTPDISRLARILYQRILHGPMRQIEHLLRTSPWVPAQFLSPPGKRTGLQLLITWPVPRGRGTWAYDHWTCLGITREVTQRSLEQFLGAGWDYQGMLLLADLVDGFRALHTHLEEQSAARGRALATDPDYAEALAHIEAILTMEELSQ